MPRGRRRPEPVPGSEYIIECDMVISAIGQRQDNSFLGDALPNRDRRGVPLLDQNLRTELPNVWAAGDYVINPTNFISSIGEGQARGRADRHADARYQAEDQGNGDHPRSDRVRLHAELAALRRGRRVVD